MVLRPAELLKMRLLADGVRVTDAAASRWREQFGGPLTLGEYATTGGVALIVEDELYVNAPLVADAATPQLVCSGDVGFALDDAGDVWPVGVVPVPAFHGELQRDVLNGIEQPSTNYGVTHTDRCRVSPISGCAWKCKFCDLPYDATYRKRHQDNMLATIRAAANDPLAPARHVLISGGTPRATIPARPGREAVDDKTWLDGVFEHLAMHSPLPVDVMMAPRADFGHPRWLRSVGVNAVSINLEISDEERARALAPAKFGVGRAHTLAYIEAAVEAFGVGQVQSLVVFGEAIEPLKSTLRGVRDLADRGCIPVLSPFRPHPLTPLACEPAATLQEMLAAYEATVDICAVSGTGVKPGPRCVACQHNTVSLPDASDFYIRPARSAAAA